MREPERIDGKREDTNLRADSSEVAKGKISDVEIDPEREVKRS
jgi:hypothetical protein